MARKGEKFPAVPADWATSPIIQQLILNFADKHTRPSEDGKKPASRDHWTLTSANLASQFHVYVHSDQIKIKSGKFPEWRAMFAHEERKIAGLTAEELTDLRKELWQTFPDLEHAAHPLMGGARLDDEPQEEMEFEGETPRGPQKPTIKKQRKQQTSGGMRAPSSSYKGGGGDESWRTVALSYLRGIDGSLKLIAAALSKKKGHGRARAQKAARKLAGLDGDKKDGGSGSGSSSGSGSGSGEEGDDHEGDEEEGEGDEEAEGQREKKAGGGLAGEKAKAAAKERAKDKEKAKGGKEKPKPAPAAGAGGGRGRGGRGGRGGRAQAAEDGSAMQT